MQDVKMQDATSCIFSQPLLTSTLGDAAIARIRVLLGLYVGRIFVAQSFLYRAKRLAGKNVSEMTHFVSSGT